MTGETQDKQDGKLLTMVEFTLLREVKVGDLMTAGSVVIASATFIYSFLKDRTLRRREYADRIRRSAAETLAAIERWREIGLRYFHDAQMVLTDTDILLVKDQDIIAARDFLWRQLVALEAATSARVLSEKLEGAYAGLYGYDPSVQQTYTRSVEMMRKGFEEAHLNHLERTQENVLRMDAEKTPFTSAALGNRLRESTSSAAEIFRVESDIALAPLRARLLALIEASDTQLVRKCFSDITSTAKPPGSRGQIQTERPQEHRFPLPRRRR